MATMTIRTTVAFDPATTARWERLSKRWGISKSETLRRALEEAEKERSDSLMDKETLTEEEISQMTPLEAFDWLTAHPQVPPGWGESFRAELAAQRHIDAEIEEEREQAKLRLQLAMEAAAK
jgi:hypothetical protein